jgi:hypothetical protein
VSERLSEEERAEIRVQRTREAGVKALAAELRRNREESADIAAMLGIDPTDPVDIAAEVICSDWLAREREKAYARGQADAFLYATTEQYRFYGQPDEGLPNPYRDPGKVRFSESRSEQEA